MVTSRKQTFDHLRSKKLPQEKTVTLVSDDDLADAYQEAQAKVQECRTKVAMRVTGEQASVAAEELRVAEAELAEIRTKVEKASVTLRMRAIGRKAYQTLLEQHPPTPEQIKMIVDEGGEPGDLMFNPDTFPVALMAATCIDPPMTLDEAREFMDEICNNAENVTVFMAAMEVNTKRRVIDLGNS